MIFNMGQMRVPCEYVSMNDLYGSHIHIISEKTFVECKTNYTSYLVRYTTNLISIYYAQKLDNTYITEL